MPSEQRKQNTSFCENMRHAELTGSGNITKRNTSCESHILLSTSGFPWFISNLELTQISSVLLVKCGWANWDRVAVIWVWVEVVLSGCIKLLICIGETLYYCYMLLLMKLAQCCHKTAYSGNVLHEMVWHLTWWVRLSRALLPWTWVFLEDEGLELAS